MAFEASSASPIRAPVPAHVLTTDAEAIAVAEAIAADLAKDGVNRGRERRLPCPHVHAFSQSGLLSMNVPQAYGGPALSFASIARVFAIVGAADATIARIAQDHIGLIDIIRCDPDETRKRALLGEALRGTRFANALAACDGKHDAGVQPRITRHGDGFAISGELHQGPGALVAHRVAVHAVDDEGKAVLAFVDRDAPGFAIGEGAWNGAGRTTIESGTVTLDKVAVRADRVVPADRAFDKASVHGAVIEIVQAGIDAGIARHLINEAIDFVRVKSRPRTESSEDNAHDDPFTLRVVADLKVKLHAAEAVLKRAGLVLDTGLAYETGESAADASTAAAEAKVLTTEIALQASNQLFELTGTRNASTDSYPDRHGGEGRSVALHGSLPWAFHAIGDYVVNGTAPPRRSSV